MSSGAALTALLQQHRAEQATRSATVGVSSKAVAVACSVEVPEALKNVPKHILSTTPLDKLILQHQHFECPEWAAAPEPSQCAHFEVYKGSERHKDLMIDAFPYYIMGLSQKICDYKFEHPSISRLHLAVVHHRTGAVFVMDLNSSNGVKVNGTRIAKLQPVQLKEGDQVQLGASTRILTLRLRPSTQLNAREAGLEFPTLSTSSTTSAAHSSSAATPAGDAATDEAQQPKRLQPRPAAMAHTEAIIPTSVTSSVVSVQQPAATVSAPVEAAPQASAPMAPQTIHVAHILLKHKDVDNPVSKAPRNRNAPVTRSVDDALKMAAALHDKCFSSPPVSLAAFNSMVAQFSECATAKNDGRMPPIVRGTFLEAFEDPAFELPVMHVSRPIQTALGVHLVLRLADPE